MPFEYELPEAITRGLLSVNTGDDIAFLVTGRARYRVREAHLVGESVSVSLNIGEVERKFDDGAILPLPIIAYLDSHALHASFACCLVAFVARRHVT